MTMFKHISATITESRQKEREETLAEAKETLEAMLAAKQALQNHIKRHDQDLKAYISYKVMSIQEEVGVNHPIDEKLMAKIKKDAEEQFKETFKADTSALTKLENQISKHEEKIKARNNAQSP